MIDLTPPIPFSTTPRFLFADSAYGEGEGVTYRFFVVHTSHPRMVVEVIPDDAGKVEFRMAEQIDPFAKNTIGVLMQEIGEFAVAQLNARIEESEEVE